MLPIICIQSPIVGPKVWARAMTPDDVSSSRPAATTTYLAVRDIIPHLHTQKGTRPVASDNSENGDGAVNRPTCSANRIGPAGAGSISPYRRLSVAGTPAPYRPSGRVQLSTARQLI